VYNVIKPCVAIALAVLLQSLCAYAGDAAKGEVIFQQCHQCHSPAQGVNVVGPSLYHVVGRPAGSIAGYAYSKAMQESAQKGLVWTPENIVAYLKDPHKFLDDFAGDPGAPNKMPFSLEDQTQREDVVAYLQSQATSNQGGLLHKVSARRAG
jgi:cytochrome c